MKWGIFEVSEIAQWLCKLATKVNVGLNSVSEGKNKKNDSDEQPSDLYIIFSIRAHRECSANILILTNRKICMTVQCTA